MSITGAGLGLRQPRIREILDRRPPVPWFEILLDNYLGIGGQPLDQLLEVRTHYPVEFHNVGMNLGSADPLDEVCELRDLLLTPRYPVHRSRFAKPESGPCLAVWRDEGRYRSDEVEPELWPVMRTIEAGQSLAAIAELPDLSAHPERLQECITILTIRGWLRQPEGEDL